MGKRLSSILNCRRHSYCASRGCRFREALNCAPPRRERLVMIVSLSNRAILPPAAAAQFGFVEPTHTLVQPGAESAKSIEAWCTVSFVPFCFTAVTLPKLLIFTLPSEVVSVAVLPLAVRALLPGSIVDRGRVAALPAPVTTIWLGKARLSVGNVVSVHRDVLVPTVSVLAVEVPKKLPLPGLVRLAVSVPAPDSNTETEL